MQRRQRYFSSEKSDDPVRDKKRRADFELDQLLKTCDEANRQVLIVQSYFLLK